MARGLSSADWTTVDSLNSKWAQVGDSTEAQHFIINKRDVERMGMKTPRAQEASATKRHMWKSKSCRFFRAQP